MDVLDNIRKAIKECGKSRYRIAKDLNLNESHLSKFMRGDAGFGVDRLMELVDYLGMELIVRPKKEIVKSGKHRK